MMTQALPGDDRDQRVARDARPVDAEGRSSCLAPGRSRAGRRRRRRARRWRGDRQKLPAALSRPRPARDRARIRRCRSKRATTIRWSARSGALPNTGRGRRASCSTTRGLAPLERALADGLAPALLGRRNAGRRLHRPRTLSSSRSDEARHADRPPPSGDAVSDRQVALAHRHRHAVRNRGRRICAGAARPAVPSQGAGSCGPMARRRCAGRMMPLTGYSTSTSKFSRKRPASM